MCKITLAFFIKICYSLNVGKECSGLAFSGKEVLSVSDISRATLGRLPLYLEYLKMLSADTQHVSAPIIAKALGLGEVLVRKDLAAVSGAGKPKVGYNTKELIERLEACLGAAYRIRAVIVGAGKLGRALLDYEGFSDYGIEITAAFDTNIRDFDVSQSGKPIYPMSAFSEFCYREDIRAGIIAVPKSAAQSVCDLMVRQGILAIWSFAPIPLQLPENVALREEDLALSLAHLLSKL